MSWKVTTGPSIEPITLDEAKRHLRILDDDSQNEDITQAIKDARDWCENYLDLAILEQTITLKLDEFPDKDYISLPRSNLISITSVKYLDEDSAEQTVATSVYGADTYTKPGRVLLKDGQEWPTTLAEQRHAVEVVYKAGFGTSRNDVPPAIKRAIKMLLAHWDSNREASIVGVSIEEVPLGVTSALDRHRLYGV